MSMSDSSSKYKRTNLFLLRVWCDDADENGDDDEAPCRVWHGRVQRTVSGEAHSFEAKDDLIAVLESMLYKDREDVPGQGRSEGKPSSQAGLSAPANHAVTGGLKELSG